MKTCRKGLHQYEGRRCTECNRAATRAWEKEHPERVKAMQAKSRTRPGHKAKAAEYMDKWHDANRESERQKALANYYRRKALGLVENSTAKVKAWRAENPEKRKEHNATYRAKHPEQEAARAKRWYDENLDRAREIGRNSANRRHARKKDAAGSHTASEWAAVVKKQHGRCAGCSIECRLTKDHIVPVSMGGSDFIFNIQGLCKPCNSRKRDQIRVGTQLGLYDKLPEHLKLART